MDLCLILNPTGSHDTRFESPRTHIKAESSPFNFPDPSFSRTSSANMSTHQKPRTTASTKDSSNPSNHHHMSSLPPPITIDSDMTDADEDSSTDDERALFVPQGVSNSKKFSSAVVKPKEKDDVKEEGFSTDDGAEEDEPVEVVEVGPSRCKFMQNCNTNCHAYRKVVSHILGRNKKCTTQIPEECWIEYCRKHYQRTKYRTSKMDSKGYCEVQLDILRRQLETLKAWDGVRSWEIAIRKKERDILQQEDNEMSRRRNNGSAINQFVFNAVNKCKERLLLSHVGTKKTYADVEHLFDFIERNLPNDTFDKFPAIELLPDIDTSTYPPRAELKAIKKSESDSEDEPSTKKLVKGKKPQAIKRSSSTPSRVGKAKPKKEQTMKTRRLVRAAERHVKQEAETVSPETSPASSPVMLPQKGYFSTAPTSSSSTPITAGPTSNPAPRPQAVMQPRKKGIAYPRQSTPHTPLPPPEPRRVAPPAVASSSSHSAFRPVTPAHRDVTYSPSIRTPIGNVSPSPLPFYSPLPNQAPRSARGHTARKPIYAHRAPSPE